MDRRRSAWHLARSSSSVVRLSVVLFWTKYTFPRQIKPGIFKLTTCRGHSNLLTVFSFVNCEEKGCYRVVSVGHLIFDCRSYCGRSCRMQDNSEPIMSAVIWKIHYSNLCVRFGTWEERRMNQPPLQRRIVRQTLPNLMLLAAPNLICRTELIQTPLFCRN